MKKLILVSLVLAAGLAIAQESASVTLYLPAETKMSISCNGATCSGNLCATSLPDAGVHASRCDHESTATDGTQTEQALKDSIYAKIKTALGF